MSRTPPPNSGPEPIYLTDHTDSLYLSARHANEPGRVTITIALDGQRVYPATSRDHAHRLFSEALAAIEADPVYLEDGAVQHPNAPVANPMTSRT